MKPQSSRSNTPAVIRGLLVLATVTMVPATAFAGLKVYEKDDTSLEVGMRLQPRMEYSRLTVPGVGTDWVRDYFIKRARLKLNGKIQGVSYGFEWKVDGTDQAALTLPATAPSAQVENAWFQYPLRGAAVQLRAGLYDAPFSRDLLTSDSRHLAVDRGAVSAVPSAMGLVDNVVGFDLRGGAKEGRIQYVVGAFDNRTIIGVRQDIPMLVGRIDLNLQSSKDLYQDAHFGTDRWISLGVNGSYQGSIENGAGADDSTNAAAGVDGMIDVPLGRGRAFVRGEVNAIRTDWHGGARENNATIKMIGAGYLMMNEHLQPFVRFDQVRGDSYITAGPPRDVTYVGANFYQKGHSLKVQGDVLFLSGTGESVDGARLQAQIDF